MQRRKFILYSYFRQLETWIEICCDCPSLFSFPVNVQTPYSETFESNVIPNKQSTVQSENRVTANENKFSLILIDQFRDFNCFRDGEYISKNGCAHVNSLLPVSYGHVCVELSVFLLDRMDWDGPEVATRLSLIWAPLGRKFVILLSWNGVLP